MIAICQGADPGLAGFPPTMRPPLSVAKRAWHRSDRLELPVFVAVAAFSSEDEGFRSQLPSATNSNDDISNVRPAWFPIISSIHNR